MKRPAEKLELPEVPDQVSGTTQESIYQRLRYAIMIGSIAPGVALTIRGLAEALEVSPTPVREALRRLNAEGALQVLDNRRVVTPGMTLERFDELVKLRILMECHAAESVLPYISDVQIEALTDIDSQVDKEVSSNDHEGIARQNIKFHTTLYKINPNQVVMPLIESIWLQLGPYRRQALSELNDYYTVDHHKAAISALKARDAQNVREAIRLDIVDGIGNLGPGRLEGV